MRTSKEEVPSKDGTSLHISRLPGGIGDIPGFHIGHATDLEAGTGCTCILCPEGAIGSGEVRGGAPATRETDLLKPEETVSVVHACVLSGGSAFGLAAASGVANELERRGIGLDVGVTKVPIVTSACVFDLACGASDVRPDEDFGVTAVAQALDEEEGGQAEGNVGVGAGCTASKLCGMEHAMKTGFGQYALNQGELYVGAAVAVNALGDIIDPETGRELTGCVFKAGDGSWSMRPGLQCLERLDLDAQPLRTNTTVSCLCTNARLDKAQALKVVQMAADSYAKTIHPTHTPMDGDTIFLMSTNTQEADLLWLQHLSSVALERAIIRAASCAKGAYGFPGACDLKRL